ncbi:LysR family transcriptional regulator [Breznakia pachnodae]|uniref:DNA-binding transcriptional LysR family regulator n=1 Tax=Breznakia pachnodae TaxID=265178 RepID=A0ABU0E515_9FIRM|nr:LysR family transcriptional regulator [Breznakia pachnodae]MDQ0361993.1 DNA-binding transcriptional LysR family regulator [Breznakia pachnodae]
MEINYIKEFVILADVKNYLEASELLFISQSSLSKHIKSLERELGVSLFERTTRSVHLSEYGETFLEYAKKIVNLQYQYTTALINQSNSFQHTITIGSIPIMAPYNITDAIMEFKKENTNFAVNLVEDDSSQLKEQLRNGTCELAFIRDNDEREPEFSKLPYTTDNLAAILPKNHPYAKEKYLTLEQLQHEDFLLLQPGSVLYNLSVKICNDAGFEPNIVFTGQRAENIIDLIEKGMGISLLMKKTTSYLSNTNIQIVDIYPEVYTQIKIYYKKDAVLSTAAKHFIDSVILNQKVNSIE